MSNKKMNTNAKVRNALKALIESQAVKPQTLTYGEDETELKVVVTPVISFAERTEMISFIVNSAFTVGVDTIQSYTPQYVKLAKRCAVLQHFTDLKLPAKLDDLWMILNHTSIYRDVIEIVGEDIDDIFDEADRAIAAQRDYLSRKTDINGLFDKIGDTIGKIDFSKEDLTTLLSVFKNMPNVPEDQIVDGILKFKSASENTENN